MSNTYGFPDPRINATGLQIAQQSPQTVQNAILKKLLEQNTGLGGAGQGGQPQVPVQSWAQVASGIANTAADQMQLRRLMGQMQQGQQQNASLLLGGSGGDQSSPAMPQAPAVGGAPPMPSASSQPAVPAGGAGAEAAAIKAGTWKPVDDGSLALAQSVINSGPPPPGGSTMGGQPGASYSQIMPGSSPAPAGGAAPGPSSPGAQPPAGATANAFGPQTGTFVNPADLPSRAQRDWPAIMQRLPSMSPQEQQDLIKEFQETAGGKNPLSFKIPNGAGTVFYHPNNPSQQQFIPDIQKEKTKDVAGNEREFEYVINPKTGERQWRGGQAPPTPEEAMSGAAKAEAAKVTAGKGAEANVKYYDSLQRGLSGSGLIAAQQKQNIDVLRQVSESQDFTPGAGSGLALGYQRLAAQFGINPTGAAPREIFNQVAARVLADQFSGLKSMSAETGEQAARIFKPMLDIEEKANITANDSLEGIKAKIDLLDKSGDLMMKWGKMSRAYKREHGRLDEGFEDDLQDDMAKSRIENIVPKAAQPTVPPPTPSPPSAGGGGAPGAAPGVPSSPVMNLNPPGPAPTNLGSVNPEMGFTREQAQAHPGLTAGFRAAGIGAPAGLAAGGALASPAGAAIMRLLLAGGGGAAFGLGLPRGEEASNAIWRYLTGGH